MIQCLKAKFHHHWFILPWTCFFKLLSFPEKSYLTGDGRRDVYGLMSLLLHKLLKEGEQERCLLFKHMQCESVSLIVLFVHMWVTVVTLPPPNQEFSFSFRDMPSPERGSGAAVLPCPALAARPCPPTPGIPRPCSPWMPSCKHKLQKLSTEPKTPQFHCIRDVWVCFFK